MQELSYAQQEMVAGGRFPGPQAGFIGSLVGTLAGASLTEAMTVDGLVCAGPIGAGVGFVIGAGITWAISE